MSQTLNTLLELFYDLNAQDLPEFFEDNMAPLMELLHKYLQNPPGVRASTNDDDEDETEAERIRASICEIVQLYAQQYTDVFEMMDTFVQSVWNMVTGLPPSKRFDGVSLSCAMS